LISSDVSGSIQCQSHLSGIPDLLLTFKDPDIIDDCSFHPCVRYQRYEKDQVVSFVPPDGDFELMRYSINADKRANFSPPLEVHAQWNVSKSNDNTNNSGDSNANKNIESSARLTVQVRVRSLSSLITSSSRTGKIIEDVAVTIPFSKHVRTAAFQVSCGSIVYDEAGKVAKWTLGKLAEDASMPKAQLTANLKLNNNALKNTTETISPPNLSLHWKVPLASVSGLTVSGLSLSGESYRPYKGVRNITKSGLFQVRYS
jgi:AP-3 complex subunit mu